MASATDIDTCERCNHVGPRWQFHTHHRDRQPWNNDPKNLERLCILCHRKEHRREKRTGPKEKHHRSFYISDELHHRLTLYAISQHMSMNAVISMLLEKNMPPLIGAERAAWERMRREKEKTTTNRLPSEEGATVPTACPKCGDDVFFRTLRGARWRCDSCDSEGTY